MLKTIGRTILILAAIALALFVLFRCTSNRLNAPSASTGAPTDIDDLIPSTWAVQTGMGPPSCDFDGDGEQESLVVYRYDPSTANPNFSLIGAVIFDSQVNRVPQEPSTESPYRPAFLVPYKLLPDIYTEKGQGYLGESGVQVSAVPGLTPCTAKEINVLGTTGPSANGAGPNFLSIFRWGDEKVGYTGVHYAGNARIQVAPTPNAPIKEFTTYDRLDDRSALCSAQTYQRPNPKDSDPLSYPLVFREQSPKYTIDFCFGAPPDPYYPEGVVVALLRDHDPPPSPPPLGDSYLTPQAAANLPVLLNSLNKPKDQREPFSILSVTNPGMLGSVPGQGYECPMQTTSTPTTSPPTTPTPNAGAWWCANEMAQVLTEIRLGGQTRQFRWTLISMADERVVDDVHWRIDRVEQLQ